MVQAHHAPPDSSWFKQQIAGKPRRLLEPKPEAPQDLEVSLRAALRHFHSRLPSSERTEISQFSASAVISSKRKRGL